MVTTRKSKKPTPTTKSKGKQDVKLPVFKDCYVLIPIIKPLKNKVEKKKVEDCSRSNGKQISKTAKSQTRNPSTRLRRKKTINYLEQTIKTSPDTTKSEEIEKVPIYNKPQLVNNIRKKQDLYEFDSDSESVEKRKKNKLDDSSFVIKAQKNKKIFQKEKRKAKENSKLRQAQKAVEIPEIEKDNDTSFVVKTQCNKNKVHKGKRKAKEKPKVRLEQENVEIPEIGNDHNHVSFVVKDKDNFQKENPKMRQEQENVEILEIENDNDVWLDFDSPTSEKNDTNLINRRETNVLTPWRFDDINIKSTPQSGALRQSALSNIRQEMIVHHSMAEKSVNYLTQTPKRSHNTTKTDEIRNVSICTQQINKINKKQYSSKGKENRLNNSSFILNKRTDKKVVNSKKSGKRKKQEEKSYENQENADQESDDDDGWFSFDCFNADKNYTNSTNRRKSNVLRPWRFNDINIKCNPHFIALKQSALPNINQEIIVNHDMAQKIGEKKKVLGDKNEEDLAVHNNEVKLFEDFETPCSDEEVEEFNEIAAKPVKKAKFKWKDFLTADPPKKTKDVRSKQEEAEAEKWAVAFNSMCKEVEEFPLEIE